MLFRLRHSAEGATSEVTLTPAGLKVPVTIKRWIDVCKGGQGFGEWERQILPGSLKVTVAVIDPTSDVRVACNLLT